MPIPAIPLAAIGIAYLASRKTATDTVDEPSVDPVTPSPVEPEEPTVSKMIANSDWGEGWHWPVPGDAIVSQEFKSGIHVGLDIMYRDSEHYYAPVGTPVLAARAGNIWSTGTTARGMNVVIDHGPPFATFYQHLDSVIVSHGQYVEAGEQIGTMGIDPTDEQQVRHLHFAVWYKGNGDSASVDPGPVINGWERT